MPFKKGKPKTGGRQKAVQNKRSLESIKRVEWVLSLLEPTLENDIQMIKPDERVKLWNDLQEFIRPKLSRTEVKQEGVSTIEVVVKRK